ncbi:MAG: bifunctional 4-hydroxy-2-oxoglutarate aldolase/2-dehydro-3-deoxy-phosphogluconate aldolase [Clostridia bacterium]|nr:bifunctional 4-hydroxy-2-oxoglutarate aldolase/2-dehydro-3-deoxy-phosphogluconate aldolase [Clostridia bacterium]
MKQIVLENPLLAILRNVPDEKLIDYAKAIVNGGVKFFEVALNSKNALGQISKLKEYFGNKIILGAGTAITIDRAKAAIDAGASFLLSPSTDSEVLKYCQKDNIPILPGALTPSDVAECVRHGLKVIKLFPAGDMPKGYIKSLKGPFDDTDYVAIGGVNAENAADFIKQGYIGVGLGSAIIPKEYVLNNEWDKASRYIENLVNNLK